MKKNGINSSQVVTATERSSYHNPATSSTDRRCDNCQYRVALNECQQFKCLDCGTYIICDYCYEELLENNGLKETSQESSSSLEPGKNNKGVLQQIGSYQKLKCVYCSSRHSINDITVKTLKSFGFIPQKGTNKVQIQSLSKEKIKKLSNLRVIQKTLVYVIGIAPEIASEDTLKSPEYFGQYGDLTKVVVNTNNVYNATRGGPSYSAYLTFSHPRESAIAILAVDQYILHDRMLRASFGTSKFCQFFMNGQKCTNKDCLYLHEIRVDLEAYTKEDMANNKFIFQEQQKIAIKLSRALEFTLEEFKDYNRQTNKNLPPEGQYKPELPSPDTIYYKDFHFLEEPLINRKSIPKQLSRSNEEETEESQSNLPAMTLSNQKNENNQTERKLSKNRISSNNRPSGLTKKNSNTNLSNRGQLQNSKRAPSNLSNSSEEEQQRRQIEELEQIVEGKQIQNGLKKKKIKIDNNEYKPSQNKVETPKETTAKKIIDLQQQENNERDQFTQNLLQIQGQPNTNKKSDVSTISKTPPHNENQLVLQMASYLLSPMIFNKKQESRFQFAHSVDPIKSCDLDEIEVPANIQDLIERNIRTLSNSMSSKSELERLNLKDMKEKWLTKKEMLMQSDRNKNDFTNTSIDESNNPLMKFKNKKNEVQNQANDQSKYNLTEHSVNIRVKYGRQSSKDNSSEQQNTNEEQSSNNDQTSSQPVQSNKQNKRRRKEDKRSEQVLGNNRQVKVVNGESL